MSKPTGKLLFAYQTIAAMEAKIERLEKLLSIVVKNDDVHFYPSSIEQGAEDSIDFEAWASKVREVLRHGQK